MTKNGFSYSLVFVKVGSGPTVKQKTLFESAIFIDSLGYMTWFVNRQYHLEIKSNPF